VIDPRNVSLLWFGISGSICDILDQTWDIPGIQAADLRFLPWGSQFARN
jgi:hypothetical protein